jgi:hypothetical protein
MSFLKYFFNNLLRICFSFFYKFFPDFFTFSKIEFEYILNFNQRNKIVFENFLHQSAQNLF